MLRGPLRAAPRHLSFSVALLVLRGLMLLLAGYTLVCILRGDEWAHYAGLVLVLLYLAESMIKSSSRLVLDVFAWRDTGGSFLTNADWGDALRALHRLPASGTRGEVDCPVCGRGRVSWRRTTAPRGLRLMCSVPECVVVTTIALDEVR